MSVNALTCPECAAPVTIGMSRCQYCGVGLAFTGTFAVEKVQPPPPQSASEAAGDPLRKRQRDALAWMILALILTGGLLYAQHAGVFQNGFTSYTPPPPAGPQNVMAPIRFTPTCQNDSFHAPWNNYTVTVSNVTTHIIYEKYSPLFGTSNLIYVTGMSLTLTINQAPPERSGPQVAVFNTTLPKMVVDLTLVYSGIQPVFNVGDCGTP
jgi:hypothetical protein